MNPMSRSHAKLLVLRLCIFSILSVHLTPAVHAQAYTPNVTYDSASVFIEGLSGVADPDTDNVIIPNGVGGTTGLPTVVVSGVSYRHVITSSFPEMASYGYSMAWSKSAKTAFIIGGMTGSTLSTFFGRWDNSVNYAWQRISSAAQPGGRDRACMVPAYNGTQLVLFGGRTTNVSLSDIWVYDVLASKWRQGSPGGLTRARSASSCAVSGDMFIVWGGVKLSSEVTINSEVISVYNLRTNTWVDSYEAPGPKTTTTQSTVPSSSGTSSLTTPNPTLDSTPQPSRSSFERIGIPVIAVVAVAILVGLLFCLYRRKKANKTNDHPIIPLGHMDDKNARSLPPVPNRPDEAGSHHFQKTALYDDTKRQPQQHQQYPIPYTAAHLNERSPGSTHRQPQGNEVQAQEQLLQEYECRWQRHLEEQRELEQRIEQQRADLQMMKGAGRRQREWDRSAAEYTPQTDRRGPQYWSMGSKGDKELPDHGWTQPQQPRGVQAYYPSRESRSGNKA
ncbi:hypothetical protein BG003_010763 [Podila horticola]|nr:hypothetical protein BG003_010763 [Podila horticola]